VLTFAVTTVVTFIYRTYCKRKFEECKFSFYWDRQLLYSLFSYSGWNIIGSIAGIVKGQGINLLLNIFFGPLLNAAYAVANQIHGALTQLVINIYSATRPQITKYCAENDMKSMWNLVFDSTKFSYCLFLLILVPFLFEMEYILTLWLGYVPEHTPTIARLVLCGFMLETVFNNQLVAVLQAANKLRRIQLFSVPILFLNLPVSYILLKKCRSPYMPFTVLILVSILYKITQVLIVKKEVNLPMKRYLTETLKLIRITFPVVLFPYTVYTILPSGIIRCIGILTVLLLSLALSVWYAGLSKSERFAVRRMYIKKYNSYVKK
jgi:O-antigen/teichoic acid export membrane protein